MNDTEDRSDIRFRKLFQRAGLEDPSSGFTAGVMDKIAGLQHEEATQEKRALLGRWAGYAGMALLVVLGLSIMYYFGVGILPESFKPFLSPEYANIFNSFRGLFDSIELSGTTVAIILGFTGLVILERLISRFRTSRNIYFSL